MIQQGCDFSSLLSECSIPVPGIGTDDVMTVPVVVLAIVLLVFAFFLYSMLRLGYTHREFQKRFRPLIGELAHVSDTAVLDPAALNQIGAALNEDPVVGHGWREFKETLITETVDGTERIYNTRQAEEFFPESAIVDGPLHPEFFRAVPSVLTSMGLLGTFVAILIGLTSIHVPESAVAGKIQGIGGFVNALSGKFLSSVLALGLAIVHTLIEHRASRKSSETYQTFCQTFDSVFPRKTTEEILTAMNRAIESQVHAFEHFNTDLSSRVGKGVGDELGPVLERVADALQSITEERDSNINQLLARLTEGFKDSMTQSAGIEFNQIASSMEQASRLIEKANQQVETSNQSFQNLADAMDQSRAEQERWATRQNETLDAMLEKMIVTIQNASSTSRATLEETVRDTSERLAEGSLQQERDLTAVMERMTLSVQEILSASQDAVDGTIQRLIERSEAESELQMEALSSARAAQEEAARVQAEAIRSSVESTLTEMKSTATESRNSLAEAMLKATEATGRVIEKMEESSTTLSSRTMDASKVMTDELKELQDLHRTSIEKHVSSVDTLSAANLKLDRSLDAWNEAAAKLAEIVPPLGDSSENFREAAAELHEVVTDTKIAQEKMGQVVSGAQGSLERLQEMDLSSERILKEHERVFQEVKVGLAETLSTIVDGITRLQDVTATGMTGQLQEFDNHLGTATQKLGATIDELSEVLDGAADTITSALPGSQD